MQARTLPSSSIIRLRPEMDQVTNVHSVRGVNRAGVSGGIALVPGQTFSIQGGCRYHRDLRYPLVSMASANEEDILGKAYDSRLMKRLLRYLRPYTWQVGLALVAIVLKAGTDVLGPYLTKVAIDRYLARSPGATSAFWKWLSPAPLTGIAQIAGTLRWHAGFRVSSRLRADLFHAVDRAEGHV